MLDTLLSGLGYIGDTLDKPGRAIRGILSGRPEEAAAIVPFSDSMGLTDPANRASGKDLLRALGADPGEGLGGDAAGLAAEIATDPLTWVGAGLGAKLGGKAATAAAARGPRYSTGIDDMERMLADNSNLKSGPFQLIQQESFRNPEAVKRLASEIPPGSVNIGGESAEGFAFLTPNGQVVRVGPEAVDVAGKSPGRPVAEGVLQPIRTVDVPLKPGLSLRAETLPFADNVGDAAVMEPHMRSLDQMLSRQNLGFFDQKYSNVGMHQGRPVVIDPGSVIPGMSRAPNGRPMKTEFTGQFNPVTAPAEPSALMRALLAIGGGDDAMRAALARGRSAPNFAAPFAFGGAGLGANLGAFSRLPQEN